MTDGRQSNLGPALTPHAEATAHASWLNQAEIYFSIVQPKALSPNDLPNLEAQARQLPAFGRRYEHIAQPFEWKVTRIDLYHLAQNYDRPAARAA